MGPDPRTGANNESDNETVKKQRVQVTRTVTVGEEQQFLSRAVDLHCRCSLECETRMCQCEWEEHCAVIRSRATSA